MNWLQDSFAQTYARDYQMRTYREDRWHNYGNSSRRARAEIVEKVSRFAPDEGRMEEGGIKRNLIQPCLLSSVAAFFLDLWFCDSHSLVVLLHLLHQVLRFHPFSSFLLSFSISLFCSLIVLTQQQFGAVLFAGLMGEMSCPNSLVRSTNRRILLPRLFCFASRTVGRALFLHTSFFTGSYGAGARLFYVFSFLFSYTSIYLLLPLRSFARLFLYNFVIDILFSLPF